MYMYMNITFIHANGNVEHYVYTLCTRAYTYTELKTLHVHVVR